MKKLILILTVFILLSAPLNTIFLKAQPQIEFSNKKPDNTFNPIIVNTPKTNSSDVFIFDPTDIELKDDAFHGSDSINFAEWWYFDAIFENFYSAQINIYVFDVLSNKFVVTGINVYREGLNVLSRENYYVINNLNISAETPFVEIDGKQFMKGYIDEISGEWIYDVTIDFTDASIDLQFTGQSKGWKGNLSIGKWATILPKAYVSGKIELYGTILNVTGLGYHDHNWNMKIFDLLNFGWYWGRIISDDTTMVWFIVMKTRFIYEYITVISEDKGNYINIDPNYIKFTANKIILNHLRFIPTRFILETYSQDVTFNITMTAISIDPQNIIGPEFYWRYHVYTNGYIKIHDETKNIFGTHIAELMQFR